VGHSAGWPCTVRRRPEAAVFVGLGQASRPASLGRPGDDGLAAQHAKHDEDRPPIALTLPNSCVAINIAWQIRFSGVINVIKMDYLIHFVRFRVRSAVGTETMAHWHVGLPATSASYSELLQCANRWEIWRPQLFGRQLMKPAATRDGWMSMNILDDSRDLYHPRSVWRISLILRPMVSSNIFSSLNKFTSGLRTPEILYRVAQKAHFHLLDMLNWYRFVKSQPNFIFVWPRRGHIEHCL